MTMHPSSTLSCHLGDFLLERFPKSGKNNQRQEPLRAWDAADEYLLQQTAELALGHDSRIAIVNDSFGALAVALHQYQPQALSDSYIAQQACRQNLADNQLPADSVTLLTSLEVPTGPLDLLLIKVPRSLASLEDQLYRLRPAIDANTKIIAAGMVKNIHMNTMALFEKIIGPTKTSLAKKKARLILCEPQPDNWSGQSPYPTEYPLENTNFTLTNHANVFSRASLDIGTRLLLKHMHEMPEAEAIVDLGCGNGVIGLLAAKAKPNASIIFADESFMAVASAEANFTRAFGFSRQAQYQVNNCLDDMPADSVDLVLNNPPFHQQSAIS